MKMLSMEMGKDAGRACLGEGQELNMRLTDTLVLHPSEDTTELEKKVLNTWLFNKYLLRTHLKCF